MTGAEIGLDAIDEVRERTNASYAACYEALQSVSGNVVQAIIRLEGQNPGWNERLRDLGRGCASQAQGLWWAAARTHIAVRQGERRIANIPVLAGAVGAAVVPGLAAAGLLAAAATKTSLTLERASAAEPQA